MLPKLAPVTRITSSYIFNKVLDKVSVLNSIPFLSLNRERGGVFATPSFPAYGIGYILTGTIGTALFLLLNVEPLACMPWCCDKGYFFLPFHHL